MFLKKKSKKSSKVEIFTMVKIQNICRGSYKTRTYETSQSCDRVHLGHLKKKIEKKMKKNSKVENQNISYGRAS